MNINQLISKELKIKVEQVENTIKLLDEGSTVPFISRYRKEVTENLDEVQIRDILDKITYLRNLEKRKEDVIKLINEQGKLTEILKNDIIKAVKLQQVEDLYLPYKKKKQTKADIAIENGLEPLAMYMRKLGILFNDIEEEAKNYINENILDISAAIDGAKLILAQHISEKIKYRESIRERMLKYGELNTSLVKKNKEKDEKKTFEDYYEHMEMVSRIPSHRILAVNRGEKEKILSVSIKFNERTMDMIEKHILGEFINKNLNELYLDIVKDSLSRLILPSVEREIRNILTEKGELDAIKIFKENLKNLMLQPPLHEKNILGLDPAYRTGCKTVVIDSDGFYKIDDVLYLVKGMHNPKLLAEAKAKILGYIEKYKIDIIVIGNGTASRETEAFVAELLKEVKGDVKYLIVSEAGASIYSASKIAAEEFPDFDVTVRGAISIARRVQDPLAELVKIDPKSIGVGMYQHDVNQKKLEGSLGDVIEGVVNSVGINVNTASWALLSHVSGVKKNVAKNIEAYRKENGKFKARKELLKVKGLGAKAYEQMAGFLIVPESENPLDNTIIHPESYKVAKELLKENGFDLKKYHKDLEKAREILGNMDLEKFIEKNDVGEETAKDIYEALVRERRDPRDDIPKPLLKSDVLKMSDLKEGMELEGTVRNVVNFGAFIDIGLKNDALLHISKLEKRVTDMTSELSVGEIIKVKVDSIDNNRNRVALTKKGL
ncbi:MAG: RNA-binding transcriptional accessory protein [Psychrilyobacter sp.]|nr:RNA-binding transcriptional accessory protein [Psychrilyobacter sp.]